MSDSNRYVAGCREAMSIDRRRLLQGGLASLALWGGLPAAAVAGSRDPRLLVMILRGGLDGLSLAAPVGDPAYAALRGAIALSRSGDNAGLPLDGMFVLNPAAVFMHELYLKRELLVLHATASPYRGRSHFDGQDVLESGLAGVARAETGWLNRAVAVLPTAGRPDPRGLAVGARIPLVMRGAAPVLSWLPRTVDLPLRTSTLARLADLFAETDPSLAKALAEGTALARHDATETTAKGGARPHRAFIETAEAAARFLGTPDGPRIGALSYEGWDTHANEGAGTGQLANRLAGLDAAVKAFASGMGDAWRETVVVVVTEFGRTARVNGTNGTDHGTATAALVIGGGVAGGRIVTDWPGLGDRALHEGRDLAATMDLRAVLKGVLADHLGLSGVVLAERIFPDSRDVRPLQGLLRS